MTRSTGSPRSASPRTFTLKEFAHLLDAVDPPEGGSSSERLRRRWPPPTRCGPPGASPDFPDEDVADPLGLGLESYRAVAWEVGTLVERIVDRVFGPAPAASREDVGVGQDAASPAEASAGRADGERRAAMREYAASWDALQETDPEVADAIRNELRRERSTLRLIASENYTSPAVLAALGSTMTNKYAEGYPGPAVLRRVRVRRRDRVPGHRAGQAVVRRRARQRPAPRRRPGQPGRLRGVPGAEEPRPEGAGDGSGPRGPPHPRLAGERLREVVLLRRLRGRQGHRDGRHGPGSRPGPPAPAADRAGRLHGLSAGHRLRGLPRGSRTRSGRS